MIWFLCGCRGQRHVVTTETQQYTSEIGVEFHELAKFWNSMAERLSYKIEFYPNLVPVPDSASGQPCKAPVPSGAAIPSGGIGFGQVKSLEFTSERIASDSSVSHTDSTSVFKTESASEANTEKESEVRQDNGTWAIVSVVAAVVVIVIVLILIRKFFKK